MTFILKKKKISYKRLIATIVYLSILFLIILIISIYDFFIADFKICNLRKNINDNNNNKNPPNNNQNNIIQSKSNLLNSESSRPTRKPLCIICQYNPTKIILAPCGHRCLCQECYNNKKNEIKKCPLCIKPVQLFLDNIYYI